MNAIDWGLVAATGLATLAVLAAVLVPARARVSLVALLTAGIGAAGIYAGTVAMAGVAYQRWLPDLLPLAGVRLSLDPLGGLFVAVAGAVVAVAAVYSIGYQRQAHRPASGPGPGHPAPAAPDRAGHGSGQGRVIQAVLPLFAWALLLVPWAASVTTFLALWELVAVTSLVLVLTEHRHRRAVADAGWWYAAMTQAGFVAILLGLVSYAGAAGGGDFTTLAGAALPPAMRGLIFVLLLIGFGSKAGLVPLHVWLPKAHPQAPSHVSAMLSAAMVNLGVYGVVRFGLDLLGGGARWWWLVVLAAGAGSALYGILQATVATDLKQLLAYSTVENMGLVFVGVGAAGVLQASGSPELAGLALAAALLHVVNHAAFKTLLFGAAGSVVRATGTADLDRLGGLRRRMPATTALFALGALSASALPTGNAFVSEWLLLQSLVHAVPSGGVVTAVAMPVTVAAVALTAGLAVATFVKALGVGFFARPRDPRAASAVESPPSMLGALTAAALACLTLAIAPAALAPMLSRAVGQAIALPSDVLSGPVVIRLTGISSTFAPALITAALVAALVGTGVAARLVRIRVRRRRAAALWDCGAGAPTARMQYTATSFAEPLQRVFDDVLAPQIDVDVTPFQESRYLVRSLAYRRRVPDRIEHHLYLPMLAAARHLRRLSPVLANGSVHRYLGYGLVGVTTLLLVLAVAG